MRTDISFLQMKQKYQGMVVMLFRYLLTLREEFNVRSVVDSLVQKGVISADAGTEIFQQGNIRSQIELCLQEVSYHSVLSTERCDQC